MAIRTAARRTATMVVLTAVAVLVPAANGLAAGGTPINVGTPFDSGPPAVAVDAAGTAYVAWANTKDLAPVTTNIVQFCVIPSGATACTHSGSLTPADGGQYIDGVQVLVDGSTVVVLADVFGTSGESAGDYVPEQEWQSTDGGATFSLVNSGLSVASGILSADTGPLSAVIVPGTGVLGYGWDSAAGNETNGAVPTFNAFPLSSPAECSTKTCSAGFAALEPNTNPDAIGNPHGQFASQQGVNAGVLGLFDTNFTNGPLGCPQPSGITPFGTAYAYAAGAQAASNNYNIPPGSPNSAWRVAVTQADCNVEYPAVGGGPSGFGVLEFNETSGETVYHRFDAATDRFDTPEVAIVAEPEQQPAVSQDGSGGVYATFLGGGSGGPISLAYSSNGGTTWTGPATLNPNSDGGAGSLTSSVGPSGQGWAAWTDNGSVYAQQFDASNAASAAVIGGSGTSTGTTVTITVTCASTPCTVTITITATEATAKAGAARKHKRTIALGSGKFTITGKGSKKLTVRLSKAGRRFLAAHHGRLSAKVLVTNRTGGANSLTTRTIKIAPARHKHG